MCFVDLKPGFKTGNVTWEILKNVSPLFWQINDTRLDAWDARQDEGRSRNGSTEFRGFDRWWPGQGNGGEAPMNQ